MTTPPPIPDWQLPPGVSRSMWEYTQQTDAADIYQSHLRDTPLVQFDEAWLTALPWTPGRLVDLGCGTGRHSVEFARRGFDVTAVDLSPSMLEHTQSAAAAAGVSLQTVEANLCDLSALATGSFDYAICMFSTLGLISGAEARLQALREIARVVKRGSDLVLHVHNVWGMARNPQGRRWLLQDLLARCRKQANFGDKPMHDQGIPNLSMHLFTRREIGTLLQQAGFVELEAVPLSARGDGELVSSWFTNLRANGWLIHARHRLPAVYFTSYESEPPNFGRPSSCEDILTTMRQIEGLYYSSFNPFHPFFDQMPDDKEESSRWNHLKFHIEPEQKMHDWMVGATRAELLLLVSCIHQHQTMIAKELDMTLMLIWEQFCIARKSEFEELVLPQLDECGDILNSYLTSIVDQSEYCDPEVALPYLERIRERLTSDFRRERGYGEQWARREELRERRIADSRAYVDRAIAKLQPGGTTDPA